MTDQGADGRFLRQRFKAAALQLGTGKKGSDQADGRALYIALAPRNLPGEADIRPALEPQLTIEQPRRVDEAVAVDSAEPREFGILQAWDSAEDPYLLPVL